MEQIINLLLKSFAISALMMTYYWLALRGRRMHTFNRFYLLLTAAAAIIVPFLHFDFCVPGRADTTPAVKLLQFVAGGGEEHVADIQGAAASLRAEDFFLWGYAAVSLLLAGWLVSNVAGIYKVRRAGNVTVRDGYRFITTADTRAPFSFFRNIFWKEGLDEHSEAGRLILKHELVHMRQWHTLDKLGMQLAIALCWFNPVFWLIHRELSLVHEYLADEEAIQDNDTSAFATMLLEPYYKSALPVMINPFFSSIKQRIMMLNKTNKTSYRNLRRAMIVPIMLVPVLLFSFRVHTVPVAAAKQPVTLVLDAGHGGNDVGATAPDGSLEKDMNLRVCKRIAALSSEYGVNVILTRTSDKTLHLADRLEVAKKQDKAVFVSIHVNRSSPAAKQADGTVIGENIASDGVELIVSGKHKNIAQCQLLASAIGRDMKAGGFATRFSQKGIWVVGQNPHPAVCVELGNMDNALDLAVINSDAGVERLSRNILGGVVAYANAH